MQVTHVYSSPVADATGTLTIWQGSSTATVAASNLVKPSNWNSAHGLIQDIGGNTLGVSSVSGSNIVLAGGSNITLSGVQGANVGSVTIIGGTGEVGTGTTFGGTNISGSMTLNSAGLALSLSGGAGGGGATSAGAFAQSNTTLSTSGTLALSSLMFAGAGAASVGVSNGSIVISAPNPAAGNVTFSGGTSSAGLASIVFSNSNGVSFGLNGSTMTGTVATNYAGQGFTSTTTAGTAIVGTLSTNGLSIGVPAFITTARGSTDGIGLNTAQTNVTWTVNSSGLSLNAAGYAGTGTTFGGTNISASITQNSNGIALSLSGLAALTSQSNQALSAANGSFTFQTAQFSNANGVSFVTSAGSAIAASVVTTYVQPGFTSTTTAGTAIVGTLSTNGLSLGVPAFLTTARGSTDGIGLNTAQTNVTWTVNSSGLSLNAAGYAGTGTTFAGANLSASITLNSGGLNLSMSAANPAAAALNVSAGTTSNNVTQLVFSNSNGVTFGLDGSTVTASAAGGAAGAPMSYYENIPNFTNVNQIFQGNSSTYVAPFILPNDMSASYLRFFVQMQTNTTSVATTANVTFSYRQCSTWNAVVYKQMTGASSLSLEAVASGSVGWTYQASLQANANGSQYTVTNNITYPARGGTEAYTSSYASTQTHFAFSSQLWTMFTANRFIDVPFATSLPASNYWMAVGAWQTVTTGGIAGASDARPSAANIWAQSNQNSSWGNFGTAFNNTIQLKPGLGVVTTNTVSTFASIAFSQITSLGGHVIPFFQMIRQA